MTSGPETSQRPWGHFEVLLDAVDMKVKRILVQPGQRLSLQRHHRRREHWFVAAGQGVVDLDGQARQVAAGDSLDIPLGAWHRVRNPAAVDLVLIEVQTGDYFGEDDIERREDDYGRVPPGSCK
ncbi:MAG: phosphomannose isomerase type II C-terminal cupin domain [bacterium]|jgi:mannose-6-phosphate isomerase|nr:phosphomannose isomerase type II C-terminal cupin domain [bacterium]